MQPLQFRHRVQWNRRGLHIPATPDEIIKREIRLHELAEDKSVRDVEAEVIEPEFDTCQTDEDSE
jgi:hypothetical protein